MRVPKSKKIASIFLYLVGVFIFQEVVFRLCFPVPEIENLDRIHYLKLGTTKIDRKHIRNQPFFWQSSVDTQAIFIHEMNSYGFRDKEWQIAKPPGKKRALFIGDSFVEGVMAGQEETLPKGFETAAGEEKVEVFNCGMLGVGLDSYLQLVVDLVPIYQPDVVFFCIYANDLGQTAPAIPGYYLEPEPFHFFKPRLVEIVHQMKRRGPLLFRWNSRKKPYFEAVPGPSNPWTKNQDQLKAHVKPWLMDSMRRGSFNPFRTNGLYKEEKHLKILPALGETLSFLQFFCEKQKTQPIVVYLPSRNQISSYYLQFERELCQIQCPDSMDLTKEEYQLHQRVLAQQCDKLNIPLIDLSETVKANEERGNHLYWKYDEHMKGKGYLLMGKTIKERFSELSF